MYGTTANCLSDLYPTIGAKNNFLMWFGRPPSYSNAPRAGSCARCEKLKAQPQSCFYAFQIILWLPSQQISNDGIYKGSGNQPEGTFNGRVVCFPFVYSLNGEKNRAVASRFVRVICAWMSVGSGSYLFTTT